MGRVDVSRMSANAHHDHLSRLHAIAKHSDGYAWRVSFLASGTPAHVGPMALMAVDGSQVLWLGSYT